MSSALRSAPVGLLESRAPGPRRWSFPLVGLIGAFWILAVDVTTQVHLGGQTLSSLLTLAFPAVLGSMLVWDLLYLLRRPELDGEGQLFARAIGRVPWLLPVFLAYAVARLIADPSATGLQNVACYAMFILTVMVTASSTRLDFRRVGAGMLIAGVVVCLVFLGEVATGVVVYGYRSIAMTCLVLLAIAIPMLHRVSGRIRFTDWMLPALFMLVSFLSLSRTATAAGAVLCCFLAVRAARRYRWVLSAGVVVCVILAVVVVAIVYPPIVARFTTGDNAVEVNGVAFNTSGRTEIWSLVYDSAVRLPIWGHGAGHSAAIVSAAFTDVNQPHNDYLRIFDDFGLVGVVLFWGGMIWLFGKLVARAIRRDEPRDWAATLAILALLIVATTDNIIVYQFVLLPIGLLVGMSLRDELGPVSARGAP